MASQINTYLIRWCQDSRVLCTEYRPTLIHLFILRVEGPAVAVVTLMLQLLLLEQLWWRHGCYCYSDRYCHSHCSPNQCRTIHSPANTLSDPQPPHPIRTFRHPLLANLLHSHLPTLAPTTPKPHVCSSRFLNCSFILCIHLCPCHSSNTHSYLTADHSSQHGSSQTSRHTCLLFYIHHSSTICPCHKHQ